MYRVVLECCNVMNFHLNSFILVVFGLVRRNAVSVKFTAITDSHSSYTSRLYRNERNEDPPSKLDPATTHASIRLEICDDISRSGVFSAYGKLPVGMSDDMYSELEQERRYTNLFHRIYDVPRSREYNNSYKLETIFFDLDRASTYRQRKEYVFVCLLRNSKNEDSTREENSNRIVPFYVSKAYDVHAGFHVHRFLFLKDDEENRVVMLAEESAKVYRRPGFNTELHYLELRKHRQPASTCTLDPVCKLSLRNPDESQSFRLCALVLTSSYFKEKKIEYPRRLLHYHHIPLLQVSFKTEEGKEEAGDELYYERTVACSADTSEGHVVLFHISRGYNPNQVFVYNRDSSTDSFHLECLSTDVNIVHERYNFGDVEI